MLSKATEIALGWQVHQQSNHNSAKEFRSCHYWQTTISKTLGKQCEKCLLPARERTRIHGIEKNKK